jgi:hypothetical protein
MAGPQVDHWVAVEGDGDRRPDLAVRREVFRERLADRS